VPSATTYAAFLITLLSVRIVPGPESMLILSRGIGQGRRIAVWTVVGMTLVAGSIQLPLLALGVASVIRSSPMAFELLRWAGGLYLVWLGGRVLFYRRRSAKMREVVQSPGEAASVAMREGLIVNLSNPIPLVFMLALPPQFVDPACGSVTAQLLVLGATQKVTGFVVLGTTALVAGTLGGWFAQRPRLTLWQERLAGTVMIALGLRVFLAITGGGQ
jgi:threonine/homoserine/homoserine lactone efflux protein